MWGRPKISSLCREIGCIVGHNLSKTHPSWRCTKWVDICERKEDMRAHNITPSTLPPSAVDGPGGIPTVRELQPLRAGVLDFVSQKKLKVGSASLVPANVQEKAQIHPFFLKVERQIITDLNLMGTVMSCCPSKPNHLLLEQW